MNECDRAERQAVTNDVIAPIPFITISLYHRFSFESKFKPVIGRIGNCHLVTDDFSPHPCSICANQARCCSLIGNALVEYCLLCRNITKVPYRIYIDHDEVDIPRNIECGIRLQGGDRIALLGREPSHKWILTRRHTAV